MCRGAAGAVVMQRFRGSRIKVSEVQRRCRGGGAEAEVQRWWCRGSEVVVVQRCRWWCRCG